MAYTIEQIGERARLKNPQAFTGYSNAQIGQTLVKSNPELQRLLVTPEKKEEKISFGQDLRGDIVETGQAIQNRFKEGASKFGEINKARKSGEQGGTRSFLQMLGTTAGTISKSIGETVTGIGKAILPQKNEEALGENVQNIVQKVTEVPVIREGLKKGITAYQTLKKENPPLARDIEALFDTSMFALDVAGGAALVKGGALAKSQIDDIARNISKGLDDVIVGTKQTIKEGLEGGVKTSLPSINLGANEYVKGRLTKLMGIFSGENTNVIENALRNPELARQAIQGGDNALRAVVAEAAENSIKVRSNFIQGYSAIKNEILGQYSKTLIPKNNLIGEFNKILKSKGVKIGTNGTLDFTTSKIVANPGEVSKIMDAYSALKNWDAKFTVDSLDEYKQLVGQLAKFPAEAGGTSKSPVLGSLQHRLNEIIQQRLPKEVAERYIAANKVFSENIGWYDDVVGAFNSGDPFTKVAGSLGKNKDTLRRLLEFYETHGGIDILPMVAGRELALDKQAAFGFLNPRSWVDFFISPKKQGEIITNIGEKLNK